MIKYSLVMLTLFILTGCSNASCEPKIVTEIKYIDRPVTVEVPVKCKVAQDVYCEFKGDGFIPTTKLLECIAMQKRVIEQCK